MTGTLTILGKDAKVIEFDTDAPASIEAAERAYAEARLSGKQGFDTKTGKRLNGTLDPSVEDQTMVPRFAGGS
jgi:hypothetical protein